MKNTWIWILLILIMLVGMSAHSAEMTFPAYLAARPSATTPLGVNDRLVVLQGGATKQLPMSGLGIPSLLSDLTGDTTHRTVTDTEKSTWNGKQADLGVKVVNCVGTDDTAAINTALSGGNVHVIVRGAGVITTPLIVYSNTWLEMVSGASITAGASGNMLNNYAVNNGSSTVTVNTAADSPTISFATDAITTADIGKSIKIPHPATSVTADASGDTIGWAGHGLSNGNTVYITSTTSNMPGGLRADTIYYVVNAATDTFQVATTSGGSAVNITSAGSNVVAYKGRVRYSYGKIIARPTSTTATLSMNAMLTVTSASATLYAQPDENILISGGTWNKNNQGGSNEGLHALLLRRVKNLTVRDTKLIGGASDKYMLTASDVTNYLNDNIVGDTISNLTFVNGPAAGVTIRNIYGTATDDIVAFNPYDNPAGDYDGVHGNIEGVLVDNVSGNTSSVALVRISGCLPYKNKNFVIRNIRGILHPSTGLPAGYGIFYSDELWGGNYIEGLVIDGVSGPFATAAVQLDGTGLQDVTIRNVKQTAASTATNLIKLGAAGKVVIDGVTVSPSLNADLSTYTVASSKSLIYTMASKTISDLRISNVNSEMSGSTVISLNGTVTKLTGSEISSILEASSFASNWLAVASGATLTMANFNNISVTGGQAVLRVNATATVGNIVMANVYAAPGTRFATVLNNLDLMLNGITMNLTSGAAFYVSNGSGLTFTLRGSGVTRIGSWTGFSRTGTETINMRNIDYPTTLTGLATTAGDKAFSTDGSPAGPVYYTGAAWKSVYSLP